MYKIKLAFLLLSAFICSSCVNQQSKTENMIVQDLKTLTPECRKVYLVGSGLVMALKSMTSNDYILGTNLLCISYTYYEMSQTEINLLSEISDNYFRNATRRISDSCLSVIEKDGDKAVLDFAKKADTILKPYIKEHLNKCHFNDESLLQN